MPGGKLRKIRHASPSYALRVSKGGELRQGERKGVTPEQTHTHTQTHTKKKSHHAIVVYTIYIYIYIYTYHVVYLLYIYILYIYIHTRHLGLSSAWLPGLHRRGSRHNWWGHGTCYWEKKPMNGKCDFSLHFPGRKNSSNYHFHPRDNLTSYLENYCQTSFIRWSDLMGKSSILSRWISRLSGPVPQSTKNITIEYYRCVHSTPFVHHFHTSFQYAFKCYFSGVKLPTIRSSSQTCWCDVPSVYHGLSCFNNEFYELNYRPLQVNLTVCCWRQTKRVAEIWKFSWLNSPYLLLQMSTSPVFVYLI